MATRKPLVLVDGKTREFDSTVDDLDGAGTSNLFAVFETFEENGSISTATNGGEHWGLGNGAELTGDNGLKVPFDGTLVRISGTRDQGSFTVEVVRNGVPTGVTLTIDAAAGNQAVTSIAVSEGDVLRPRTTAVATATIGTVSFLIIAGSSIPDAASIGTLSDVDLTGLANGQTLVFNSTSGNFEPGSGGGVDVSTAQAIAAGSTLGLQQLLLAQAGQPGLTVLAVGQTNTGKVQGVSLGAGNVVEVYATGADFNAGNVLYREFMAFGEVIVFTGLSNGSIITATQGFYGVSENFAGSSESPMPLLSYGLSFDFSFFFGFRNSSNGEGFAYVVNGPLDNEVTLTDGNGTVILGQENIAMTPWQFRSFNLSGNQEYILDANNPIMACVAANQDVPQFYDMRLIMPLTNDGITWPRSGNMSAPFDNTQVAWYTRDNAEGFLNSGVSPGGVSPGSPVDMDASPPVGTGASDQDYEPNGCTRFQAVGLISGYSGADSAGLEASPMIPVSALSQVVAQPFLVQDNGDGGNSGVAIGSPFEGTAQIFEWNQATSQLDLAYTVPLTRNGVTITSQSDQLHPAAGLVANETANGTVALVGDLQPGVIVADVPITVISQAGVVDSTTTFRSQNGGTATNIVHEDDETLMLGITPSTIAVEIREDANGVLRKRVIDGSGVETWVVA